MKAAFSMVDADGEILAEVVNFPIQLAYATTIHKSQGVTLNDAIIDIGKNIFEYGQTYVALSRVKSLDGLYLTSFDYNKIMANPKVKQFYNNIKNKIDIQK